ncbi:zinc finger and SCAN domain-containing protein 5B [Dasypus novemcinctus]|uniref:zinc finger and SCAN domain-containing protein 5B n=1 Tax=Dasypus novemcinctus TaxID=9361 RepID=UPI00265F8F73|nr:zinc finger and SCAN domain-containing protein 5B [Dasypus novemcinctus]
MATDLTVSSSKRKSHDSPGSEPPQFVSSQGTGLEEQDCDSETWHVSFRGFACPEELDPITCLRRLSELCHFWLRPDLHTKEQILDKLVMEQFMICMPLELQVLVKESGVKSCKDLENMLRNNRTPKMWSIVSLQGQEFLLRNSDVQMAESESSDADDVRALSGNSHSPVSGTQLENSQEVCGELRELPENSEMSRGQYQCEVCEKRFQYKSQFDIHQRAHTGERPFKCNSCGKGFIQPSDLRVHQRIHTGEKPYRCELCHKEFTHESTLQGHRRIHTKEKPFHCKDCGKCFSHKGNLNVHQRIHTGIKPYKCPVCREIFRQLGTFKRHLKIHSKATSS